MATARTGSSSSTYSTTRAGADVYGRKPDPIDLPDPLRDIARAVPQYGQITDLLSSNIINNLMGDVSGILNPAIATYNARNVGRGVGGSQFGENAIALGIGREAQALRNLGVQQALPFFQTQSQIGTVPQQLQTLVQSRNADIAAAPNPVARGNFEQQLFNEQLERIYNPSGPQGPGYGAGGGTGGISYTNLAGDRPTLPDGQHSLSDYETYQTRLNQWNQRNSNMQRFGGGGGFSGTGGEYGWFNQPTSGVVPSSPMGITPNYQAPSSPYTSPIVQYGFPTAASSSPSLPQFNAPSNFGELSPSEAENYYATWLQNSGINPADYE